MIKKYVVFCSASLLLLSPVAQAVEPVEGTESLEITQSETVATEAVSKDTTATEATSETAASEAETAKSVGEYSEEAVQAGEAQLRQILTKGLDNKTRDEELTIGQLLYSLMFTNSPEAGEIWKGLGMDWSATPTTGNYITEYNDSLAWFRGADKEMWTLANGNVAYFVNNNSSKTAIISHGYRGSSNNMGPWAKLYADQGFNVLVPDATGHGDSQPGADINFGWLEKENYKEWINQVLSKTKTTDIMLQGMSMGSATVLMTSGESLPAAVKGVVADSAYTSVLAEVSYLKQLILSFVTENQGLISIILDAAIEEADEILQEKQGFSMAEASSLNQVAQSQIPTLFIHSIDDNFIPVGFVDELYQAKINQSREAKDRLWKAGGGDHIGGIIFDLPGYKQQVTDFVKSVIPEDKPTEPTDPSETDTSEGQGTTGTSEGEVQETTGTSEGQGTTGTSEGEVQETTDTSEGQGTTGTSQESQDQGTTGSSEEGHGTTGSSEAKGQETGQESTGFLPQTGERVAYGLVAAGLAIVAAVLVYLRKGRQEEK